MLHINPFIINKFGNLDITEFIIYRINNLFAIWAD